MAECPSKDWDRRCYDLDEPELCPMCGAENSTKDGEWVCPEHPVFCSAQCAEECARLDKAEAEAYARDLAYMRQLIAEHNVKCPKCKDKKKYCTHQD